MLSNLTYRQPRYAILVVLMVIATGLSSLLNLGRQEDPTITNLFGTITTAFPGADPERVESLVSIPIEESLEEIPEIDLIESASRPDVSVVTIELSPTLPDRRIEQIWAEVRDAVADAQRLFPDGVLSPDIDTNGIGAYSAVVSVSLSSPDAPLSSANRFAETIADRMRGIPDTRIVSLFGVPEEEVLVSVDPYEAGAVGISIGDIATQIQAADGKVLAGRLSNANSDVSLAVSGEIKQLDRVRSVVLRETGDGEGLRVESVATVSRGPREPASEMALVNGHPAVLIGILAQEGVQIDRWMAFVKEEVAAASDRAPRGYQVDLLFDQSIYTVERLTEVGINMAMGMAIVVAVLFVTLGLRAALIVTLIMPMVSLATVATLAAIGLPLHQMSVTGLIVSLGLVVDAAIVMTNLVGRWIREGLSRAEAVAKSVKRLAGPLFASTFTTILSFTPMMILPGAAGDFVGSIAIAVAVMLIWSLVFAMVLTPALSGLLLADGEARFSGGIYIGPLARLFRWIIRLALANPFRSIAIAFILPVIGFAMAPKLTPQFFPTVERNQFYIDVEMSSRASIDYTAATVREMDALLRSTDEITETYWMIGGSAPGFYYNIVGGRSDEPGFAQAMVTTQSSRATVQAIPKLQAELNRKFPEARVIVRRLVQGPPVEAPVELRIVGQDLSVLRQTGEELQSIMSGQPTTVVARSGIVAGTPRIRYHIDEEEARRLGLEVSSIAQQLELGLNGITSGSMLEGTEQIPVRIRFSEDIRADLGAVNDMPIFLPPAQQPGGDEFGFSAVPLSSLAEPVVEASKTTIYRRNAERVNTVQAFIPPDILPEQALKDTLAAVEDAEFTLPAGYRLEIGGDSDQRDDTVRDLLSPLGLIVALTVATAVLTFNSFRLTMGVLLVAAMCAGLSLFSLALAQFPFGINAVIGVIGSVGVSINAAILIITSIQENPKAASGDLDAAADEVIANGRHIFSTTLTTFGGFVPLILADGLFWPPFAVAIAGGVLLSSTIAFFYTAPMYFILHPRKKAVVSAEAKDDDAAMAAAAATTMALPTELVEAAESSPYVEIHNPETLAKPQTALVVPQAGPVSDLATDPTGDTLGNTATDVAEDQAAAGLPSQPLEQDVTHPPTDAYKPVIPDHFPAAHELADKDVADEPSGDDAQDQQPMMEEPFAKEFRNAEDGEDIPDEPLPAPQERDPTPAAETTPEAAQTTNDDVSVDLQEAQKQLDENAPLSGEASLDAQMEEFNRAYERILANENQRSSDSMRSTDEDKGKSLTDTGPKLGAAE